MRRSARLWKKDKNMDGIISNFKSKTFQGIIQGISTRGAGSIKKNNKPNKKSLEIIINSLGIQGRKLIMADQVHGGNVEYCTPKSSDAIYNTDGLITNNRKLLLCITIADCLSITFFDKKKNIVGVAHAGYKGLLNNVILEMVRSFEKRRSKLSDIYIGLGPAIGVCCYDVAFERVILFKQKFPYMRNYFEKRDNKYFLSLTAIAKQVLIKEGIGKNHIEDMGICTKCNLDLFYSYRGDSIKTFGQFGTFAGLI